MNCKIDNCTNNESRRGLCQKHYKQDRVERMARGERIAPGPSQDPAKPYSKHRPKTRHLATDTHCANGHEWDVAGVYVHSSGKRQCKVCRRKSGRKSYGLEPIADSVPMGLPNKEKTHCPRGHELAGENLYVHPTKNYRRCLTCHSEINKRSTLRNLYGITLEQYKDMLSDQAHSCAICSRDFGEYYPVVDHDHETGDVRGLLCTNCNTLIGHAYDDITKLKSAIKYLEQFSNTTTAE